MCPLSFALLGAGCQKPPDRTPEGALREWVETMDRAAEDPRKRKEAYGLLASRARANLTERARRASILQGHRIEPYEMLDEGRFVLRFRPRTYRENTRGDLSTVQVKGYGEGEVASVQTVLEGGAWRVDIPLPEPPALPQREEPPKP